MLLTHKSGLVSMRKRLLFHVAWSRYSCRGLDYFDSGKSVKEGNFHSTFSELPKSPKSNIFGEQNLIHFWKCAEKLCQ